MDAAAQECSEESLEVRADYAHHPKDGSDADGPLAQADRRMNTSKRAALTSTSIDLAQRIAGVGAGLNRFCTARFLCRLDISVSMMRVLFGLTLAALLAAADDRLASIAELEKSARAKVGVPARVVLVTGESAPNYSRALGTFTDGGTRFEELMQAVFFKGSVEPETKMAMGVRMAQSYKSAYPAAHLMREMRASASGREILRAMAAGKDAELAPARLASIRYAERMARNIHGVDNTEFTRMRTHFNDSQIVELTLTVCFFSYWARLAEALNLPLERWVLDTPAPARDGKYAPPAARVGLISDAQMEWARSVKGTVNSQRAMFLSPEIAAAWRAYGGAVRARAELSREILLHVSFAVSMANGCRYCTLHQVQGLRRLNVSPSKLMAMKKDDSQLTPRELAAVEFARKLTREPASVTDADYAKLKAEFGERGALEAVLQTCTFAFMNRFTDGLRLPSEDEAVRIYREVYGGDFVETGRD